MNRRPAKPNPARLHPLLFDCCRCGIGREMACLMCKRWQRLHRTVAQRRAAWGRI